MNFPARIIHPDHGAMHVYNSQEWALLEPRGWMVEAPEPAPVEVAPKKLGRPKKVA